MKCDRCHNDMVGINNQTRLDIDAKIVPLDMNQGTESCGRSLYLCAGCVDLLYPMFTFLGLNIRGGSTGR